MAGRGLAATPGSASLGSRFDVELMITGDILDWARAAPDKTAVIHNGRALTYRDLASRSLAPIDHLQTRTCALAARR